MVFAVRSKLRFIAVIAKADMIRQAEFGRLIDAVTTLRTLAIGNLRYKNQSTSLLLSEGNLLSYVKWSVNQIGKPDRCNCSAMSWTLSARNSLAKVLTR